MIRPKKDFDNLNQKNIKEHSSGATIGELPDGRIANVRPGSS